LAKAKTEGIDRTKTGLPGLDALMGGGIPSGNLVVISGDPGSGKTVLCWQFLYAGAEKYNEPGLYVSLEESAEDVLRGTLEFGMDWQAMMDKNLLKIVTVELYDFERLKNTIEDTIRQMKAKRVVIDPGVIFRLFFERELDARKRLVSLAKMLKAIGCTSIITNEITLDKMTSLYGLEEFVADGVILVYHTKLKNAFLRSIGVLKMRNTEISDKLRPIQITGEGIKVLAKSELFSEVK